MFKRIVSLTAAAVIVLSAGCVGAPPRPQQPPPRRPMPVPRPAAPPAVAPLAHRPFTPGTWSYAGGIARFGAGPLFEARCDTPARRVVLTVTGAAAASVTLRASTSARTVAATPGGGGSTVQLAATDALLDALAFSRGSFTVQAGTTILTLPAWPEFGRVIEDCRG